MSSEFHADYALTSQNGFTPTVDRLGRGRSVSPASRRSSPASARATAASFGKSLPVAGVDPGISKVLKLNWQDGTNTDLDTLGMTGAILTKGYAKNHDLTVGSPIRLETPGGKFLNLRVHAIVAPPQRRLAARHGHDLVAGVRLRLPEPAERLHVRQYTGWGHPGEHREAERRPRRLPGREDPDRGRVHPHPGAGDQPVPHPALRPARALDHRQPVRDREHADPDRVRADARDRDAPRGRDDAPADAADDPPRGRDHRAARRGARDPGRARARVRSSTARSRTSRSSCPWGTLIVFIIAAIIVGLLAAIFPARRASKLNVLNALQYE